MMPCLLCTCDFPEPPAGMNYRQHAYITGFADGARAVLKTLVPHLCDAHAQHVKDALQARGIAAMRGKDAATLLRGGKS